MSPQELREDVSVLNVVNFGGGAYVLYAEVCPTARSRSTPSRTPTRSTAPRGCCRSRRALLAAIELLGVHLSEHPAHGAREARVARSATSPRRGCSSPTRAPTTRSRARSARRSRSAA